MRRLTRATREVGIHRLSLFSDGVFAVLITILAGPQSAAPVSMYAAVFVLVNITYVALCWEAVDRPRREDVTARVRRLMHMRSVITIGVFAAAAVVALWRPVAAMALICVCLIGYLRPDVPATRSAGQSD